VLERLAAFHPPVPAALAEAGEGMDLAAHLAGFTRVLLVGAFLLGLSPGAVRTLSPEELEESLEPPVSPREVWLPDLLEMASLAGFAPQITVVAVQPLDLLPGESLSAPVEAAVSELVRRVVDLVND
jgi:hydrogenase maturation protease